MQRMVDAISQLRRQGYNQDFTFAELCGFDANQFGHQFVVDQTYRFDELSDPEDQSALYAISSRDGQRRGLLINGYGVYSDPFIGKLLEHIETKH